MEIGTGNTLFQKSLYFKNIAASATSAKGNTLPLVDKDKRFDVFLSVERGQTGRQTGIAERKGQEEKATENAGENSDDSIFDLLLAEGTTSVPTAENVETLTDEQKDALGESYNSLNLPLTERTKLGKKLEEMEIL